MGSQKILLVQLFSNGDCLYATAVARQIKNDYPSSHLTWAIAGFCKNIIFNNPYVDEVKEVNDVPKSDVFAFRAFLKKIKREQREGIWDKVIITHNDDRNLALYDGTIRGMILRAYPGKMTVPLQPVLFLTEHEKQNAAHFAESHSLKNFKNVILWEFAPQSGQSVIAFDFVKQIAEKIAESTSSCIILTSPKSFESTKNIVDASCLTIRENAALTHYCTLLIGCSSGITWLSTSNAAKQLPMVQLLNGNAVFRNAPSEDFKRIGFSGKGLIELYHFNADIVFKCIVAIMEKGFSEAQVIYNQQPPVQFNTTRRIVYHLLCFFHFKSIIKHFQIISSVYDQHSEILKQFMLAVLEFPMKLLKIFFKKRIKKLVKLS